MIRALVLALIFVTAVWVALPKSDGEPLAPQFEPEVASRDWIASDQPLMHHEIGHTVTKPPKKIYRKVVNGEVVYEGALPPSIALSGPEPVEKGDPDPTLYDLTNNVKGWLDNMKWIPVDPLECATQNERNELANVEYLRLVGDRHFVALHLHSSNHDEALLERVLDLYCEQIYCIEMTRLTHSTSAQAKLMEVDAFYNINAEIRQIKRELERLGVSASVSAPFVSPETIYALTGGH